MPSSGECREETPSPSPSSKLASLRSELSRHALGAYLLGPSDDPHSSEYVSEAHKAREWISGFSGSAGTVLVSMEHALLWVDGRYFLQAEKQVDVSLWQVMRSGEPAVEEVEEWCEREHRAWHGPLGVDPSLFSLSQERQFTSRTCTPLAFLQCNLVNSIWKDRPPLPRTPIVPRPLARSGESVESKLQRAASALREQACDALVLNALDQIGWLFNCRGSDIECNPVFFAYALLSLSPMPSSRCAEGDQPSKRRRKEAVRATLYIRALDPPRDEPTLHALRSHLRSEGCLVDEGEGEGSGVVVLLRPYLEFNAKEVASVVGGGRLMLEKRSCTLAMASSIPEPMRCLVACSPIEDFKSIKNRVEVEGILAAGRRDAAVFVSYLAWLEAQVCAGKNVSESEGAAEIRRRRANMEGYVGEAFPTISSSGPNAAVIHYHAIPGEDAHIDRQAVYLCDTGGQFVDGTTDMTRTVHMGSPSAHETTAYTRVLQGHIALATAVFPAGTPGIMLEMLARGPLWRDGMNYLHGTGHGIGAFLNVHEGPLGIGGGARHASTILKNERMQQMYLCPIEKGMYLSDEPGFYLDGKFGIRIESDLVVAPAQTSFAWGSREFLRFINCSPVPLCPALIDQALLSDAEKAWINAFHKECRAAITDELLLAAAGGSTDEAADVACARAWLLRTTAQMDCEMRNAEGEVHPH